MRLVLNGDKYHVQGTWEQLFNRLGDTEELWVKMMMKQGDLTYDESVVPTGASLEGTVVTLAEMEDIIDIGCTSAEMDGWDPDE